MLGGGSNLLVTQSQVPGVVIHLSAPEFCELRVDGDRLHAGASAKLGHANATAVREGLGGLESLVSGGPGPAGCGSFKWAIDVTSMHLPERTTRATIDGVCTPAKLLASSQGTQPLRIVGSS